MKALLAHQADPNTQMTKGTPVRRNSQDFELPKTLIGATPYLLAAKFLEADIMRALAAAGADTRLPMKDGATPLMAAAGMGITPPVQDEKRGTDRRGLAILDGGKVEPDSQVLEAVSAALALGSDINAANHAGDTAVHIAAAQGYGEVVKLLASQGADLNVRNAKGLTPLAAVATRAGRTEHGRSAPIARRIGVAMIDLRRRQLIAGLLASSGLAASAGAEHLFALAQSASSAKPFRIDIHHHFAPPAWVTAVKGRPLLQPANTTWTPEKSIEDMDRGGVAAVDRVDHQSRAVVRRRADDAPAGARVQRVRREARAGSPDAVRTVRGACRCPTSTPRSRRSRTPTTR